MAAAVDLELGRQQVTPSEQVGHCSVCISVAFFSFEVLVVSVRTGY